MILLTSTSDLVQLVTGSAVTIDAHASYVDIDGATVTPGRLNTLITTAATTTIVGSPSGTAKRTVKTATIRNKHASSSCVVTIKHTDGATIPELVSVTLLAGETLSYHEGNGWSVIQSAGGLKLAPAAGRWLRTTVLTAASGTHTVGPDCASIFARIQAGGGGGGGCTSVASAGGAAGGGGSGGYAEKTFAVTPGTGYAYTCGALGAGASGGAGGNGANSTLVVGATTVTALGGIGGPVMAPAATLKAGVGGAGGAVSTNGDVNRGGAPGGNGICLIVATPIIVSGEGGSSPFGGGGVGIAAVGNGIAATGFGAGGGGSATGASAVRTGGNGSAGCIVVDEYA